MSTPRYQTVTHGGVTLKIYEIRRGRRRVYSVAYKHNGSRQLKQFTEKVQADQWAYTRAKEMDRGSTGALLLSPAEAAEYVRAREILKGYGRPLDAIARDYVDAMDSISGVKTLDQVVAYYAERMQLEQRTVPQVLQELLISRADLSIRHINDLKYRLQRFAADMTGNIGNVTQKDLYEWLAGLGVGPRSRDNFRQTLVLLFRFAQRQGYLPEGKTEAQKVDPLKQLDEEDIQIFTVEEMQRLLKVARADVRPFLVLGAFAGIRTAEICRLDWSEIDFDLSHIEIKRAKAKTRSRRLIPMQDNLINWLKLNWERSGPIMKLARPEKTAAEVVCRATQTEDRQPVVWKRNGLRHSFCSYRLAVSQNEHAVSAEMGNTPEVVYQNYRALVTKEQGETWFAIDPNNSAIPK